MSLVDDIQHSHNQQVINNEAELNEQIQNNVLNNTAEAEVSNNLNTTARETRTRSGRISRPPSYLRDYVK